MHWNTGRAWFHISTHLLPVLVWSETSHIMVLVSNRAFSMAVSRNFCWLQTVPGFYPFFCAAKFVQTLGMQCSSSGCELLLCTSPGSLMPHARHQLLCSSWQENALFLRSARKILSSHQFLHKAVHIFSLTRYMALLSVVIDCCSLLEPRERMHEEILWLTRKKCVWVILKEYNSSEGTNILLMLTALENDIYLVPQPRDGWEIFKHFLDSVSPFFWRVTSEVEGCSATLSLHYRIIFGVPIEMQFVIPVSCQLGQGGAFPWSGRGLPLRCFPAHL